MSVHVDGKHKLEQVADSHDDTALKIMTAEMGTTQKYIYKNSA